MSSVVVWGSCLQNQGAVTTDGEVNSQQGGGPHPWPSQSGSLAWRASENDEGLPLSQK